MTKSIQLNDNHLFLTSSNEVDSVSQPLKKRFNVTSLVYQRNFPDGTEIRLSNQPDWVKHFYANGYYKQSGFEKHPDNYQSGFVIWSHLTHHATILQAAKNFNINHGITIINKIDDDCEYFFLGTTHNTLHLPNLLLNNIEYMHKFMRYFKDQLSLLIKRANQHRILIPNKFSHVFSNEAGIIYKNSELDLPGFHKKTLLQNNFRLSRREQDCAKLYLQGNSARVIGEHLYISRRTVETHIQHIKSKLNCRTKSELILKLSNFDF